MGSYWRSLRMASRNARLYLVSAGMMGFTVFGGVYSLLRGLYLLRLGYGPEFIGVVAALGMLGWALACLPAGMAGRILGPRRAMILGLGLATLGYCLWPLVEWLPAPARSAWLVATYLFSNLAIALYDVNSQPFLMDATSQEERDHIFSLQAALWPVAGFLGSLAGGVLPAFFAGLLDTTTQDPAAFRYPILLAGASLGIGVAALCFTQPTQSHEHLLGDAASEAEPFASGAAVPATLPAADGALYRLMAFFGAVVLLGSMGEGAARTFFTVYLDDGLATPTATIGTLAALGQLLAAPAALAMPLAARRWGHDSVFQWGLAGMALALLPLAWIPHWSAAGLGYMAMITLVSITRPAVTIYMMQLTPIAWRPTISGVYTMAIGLSWSLISLGGGYLIAGLGYPVFFLGSALLTGAGALLFVLRQRHTVAMSTVSP